MSEEYKPRAEEITPQLDWEDIPPEDRCAVVEKRIDEEFLKKYDPEFYLAYAAGKKSTDEVVKFDWDIRFLRRWGELLHEGKLPAMTDMKAKVKEIAQQSSLSRGLCK